MISLFNVKTVARFESKTLLRSWFFRIFAGIGLLFLLFFNMFGVTDLGDGGWPGRLLPSGVPYMNIWMLNIAQAIIAVFLSADFLGRDKKLDTTEAFYVRSMSNTDYVIGKTIGILKVFVGLNLMVVFLGLLFMLIANEVSIPWLSFLIYPLLMSLPTLVFILGLSFFTMTLIRNQAITFVVLLGFLALSLFYLQNKWYALSDILGFWTPFMRSDFTGFGNELALIYQRFAYLLLGVGFILATIWRLPRLEQAKGQKPILGLFLIMFFVGGASLLFMKAKMDQDNLTLRSEMRTLNTNLKESSYLIEAYAIKFKHEKDQISVDAELGIHALADNANELVLALNPGLKIRQANVNGTRVSYKRDKHLAYFDLKGVNASRFNLSLNYEGEIIDAALFPEIADEVLLDENRIDPLLANKQGSFVTDKYVLLTREANWYPVVASKLYWTSYPFTTMDIEVSTANDLEVISQGSRDVNENVFRYISNEPLNAHSIVIGEFERLTTNIDSIEFNLYYHPSHDYFKEHFSELSDTASVVIKSVKDDFERKLGLKYPFQRFSIVEAPINMYSYLRNWTLATENIMPEMVLFPENGGGDWQNDLSRITRRTKRRKEDQNEAVSDKELQTDVIKNFLGDNFIQPRSFFWGRQREGERSVENWGRYQIFPSYFSYSNSIVEENYPLLTIALENYYHQRLSETRRRGIGGLSANDEVILKLRDKSLVELIDEEDVNMLGNVFASKGSQLFSGLKINTNQSNFNVELDTLLTRSRFSNIALDNFSTSLSEISNLDFEKVYNNWLNEQYKPAFLFGEVSVWEVKDGNRVRFFMKVPVSNSGDADGIIAFTVREGQQRRGGRGRFRSRNDMEDDANEQSFQIKKGETAEIGFLLDDEPRELKVNTFLARNIPSTQQLSTGDIIKDKRKVDFYEGKRLSTKTIKYKEPYEIIVDNEDEGCEIINTGESKTIKDWWLSRQNEDDENDTYGMIRFWSPPVKWKPVAGESFFGEYLKSAYYKRKGSGTGSITWTADITETGNYEVYAYVPDFNFGWGRGRDRKSVDKDYEFTVHHDDGDEAITVTINKENNQWVYLGDFYFSEGKAKVQLSDMTNVEYVIGDAVKWVKK
ncbi:hypothetical protein [Carboxylicivirga sp. N1Y90]|uniref:golvesin C-terminal-like domain-containing protein n=1 Tax=Carboxylicivirga fragile TaxID=3417571 RepID=UPI003D328BD7|nr:hypothetical protein [Marinilabiliaceae bacterium N1Y90]